MSLCSRKDDTGADDPTQPFTPVVVINQRLQQMSFLLHKQIDSLLPHQIVPAKRDTLAVNLTWKDREEGFIGTILEHEAGGREHLLNDRSSLRTSARTGSVMRSQPSWLQPTLTARHRAGSLISMRTSDAQTLIALGETTLILICPNCMQ